MNSTDIDKLVRWAVDSDLKKFAEDAYGVTGTAFDVSNGMDDYLRGKFRQMQTNFIFWLGGLDNKNRTRLAKNITSNGEIPRGEIKIEEEFDPNEIGIEATKMMMSVVKLKGEK